jgi:hypothetical protein
MLPPQMEALAQTQREHHEKEAAHRRLLALLPKRTPRWRRWLGYALFALGTTLMRGGAHVAQQKHNKQIFAR